MKKWGVIEGKKRPQKKKTIGGRGIIDPPKNGKRARRKKSSEGAGKIAGEAIFPRGCRGTSRKIGETQDARKGKNKEKERGGAFAEKKCTGRGQEVSKKKEKGNWRRRQGGDGKKETPKWRKRLSKKSWQVPCLKRETERKSGS